MLFPTGRRATEFMENHNVFLFVENFQGRLESICYRGFQKSLGRAWSTGIGRSMLDTIFSKGIGLIIRAVRWKVCGAIFLPNEPPQSAMREVCKESLYSISKVHLSLGIGTNAEYNRVCVQVPIPVPKPFEISPLIGTQPKPCLHECYIVSMTTNGLAYAVFQPFALGIPKLAHEMRKCLAHHGVAKESNGPARELTQQGLRIS
mmetsp:Transcript_24562/g.50462  ORF Transcript_24562/g.50462 Transcript_24562/m.50462 type:complete len:204 (-) Transcript_24562:410-1021(-)